MNDEEIKKNFEIAIEKLQECEISAIFVVDTGKGLMVGTTFMKDFSDDVPQNPMEAAIMRLKIAIMTDELAEDNPVRKLVSSLLADLDEANASNLKGGALKSMIDFWENKIKGVENAK